MSETPWGSPSRSTRPGGRGWLHVLWIGIVLFILATIILFFTGNPNLYPTVILIGNFLVPVVFVAFLYDHQHLSTFTPETIGQSFIIGGILGVLGASVLEALLIPTPTNPYHVLTLGTAMLVGLIEEGCKIAAVLFLARHMQHNRQIDGLLMGAAVGMGFAALESTGYAFTTLLASHGYVEAPLLRQSSVACWLLLVMVSGQASLAPSSSERVALVVSASPVWSFSRTFLSPSYTGSGMACLSSYLSLLSFRLAYLSRW